MTHLCSAVRLALVLALAVGLVLSPSSRKLELPVPLKLLWPGDTVDWDPLPRLEFVGNNDM